MFAYEKGLIWGNDNYRTNGALVNVALATGNVGRPGGGCVRMGGHQEGYVRPDYPGRRPAPYVDKLLLEGKGGVHHIWACDHYKTTLNADKFKQNYKKRTDLVKDAMSAVPYGDQKAMVAAILAAIGKGGLFAVDVDIVPTKIGQACHVWLPAATAGEMNLTSMNGERRLRLTERYMDPPGQAMPDCLIAARLANNLERVFREMGKPDVADKFKGFDWKTEEDAFMDGYHANAKGGEFVTYERLRAMGTNGVQEPATGFENGKLVGTKRLFTDGKFGTEGRQGDVHGDAVARASRRRARRRNRRNSRSSSTMAAPTTSGKAPISTSRADFVMDRWPYPLHPDEPGRHEGARSFRGRPRGGPQRQRRDAGDGVSDADRQAQADVHAVRLPDGRAGKRRLARRQRTDHSELQADLGQTFARSPPRPAPRAAPASSPGNTRSDERAWIRNGSGDASPEPLIRRLARKNTLPRRAGRASRCVGVLRLADSRHQ